MAVSEEMVLAGAKALHEEWRTSILPGGSNHSTRGIIKDETLFSWENLHQDNRDSYLRTARTALAAALSDQVAGWQPIETAPKDGCYLLANDRREVCAVQSRDGHRIVQNMVGFADWEYGSKAIGWQPLPAPPPIPASTPVRSS